MLYEICMKLHNFFPYPQRKRYVNNYAITGGEITPPVYVTEGQYYRIKGSGLNDGIYKRGEEELKDEPEFYGYIEPLCIPQAFLDLVQEMEDWQEKYGNVDSNAMSPYTSESFSIYSYSKTAGSTSADGSGGTDVFSQYASRLKIWYKPPGLAD